MNYRIFVVIFVVIFALLTLPLAALARDQLLIVGSSTVYPFSASVAEHFGKGGKFATPVVEQNGTGGGIKFFCEGAGEKYPDLTNASRPMKDTERELCKKNGVTDIAEIKIGFDGIVLAESKKSEPMAVTIAQLFRALAKQVPADGKLVANPYKNWSDVDTSLPAHAIEIYGPPDSSGTLDAFLEIVMEQGCKAYPEFSAAYPDEHARKEACKLLREDGAYIRQREDDNVIVQKILASPGSLGIFGYSYLEHNLDKVRGLKVDGIKPEYEAIADGSYPLARSLFVYVKKAHIGKTPGVAEFMEAFTGEDAAGEDGYLALEGLITLPEAALEAERKKVAALKQ